MTLIKSISGIRGTIGGKVGDNLTPVDAVKFASAYGTWLKEYSKKALEQVEIKTKYEGYISREKDLMEVVRRQDSMKIPVGFDFSAIPGMSTESKSRLADTRPETIGQASRVPGITPAAVANLMIHLKIREKGRESARI